MTEAPSSRLRVAIVDDEALARSVLREYLTASADVDIVAECQNGFEAVKVVSELHPDLLFLDVQMPKLDGFEVLELVGRDVAVVFTTAYDQYALRAFEVHAIDYLLKPFSAERLATPEIVSEARAHAGQAGRVLVRDGSRVHVLSMEKIDYVQAQDDYVSFRCDGRDYLKDQTLAQAEAALDPAKFVRIHRSYLLNLDRLARVETDERENRLAVLSDGRKLPVSRSGYARLSARL